MSQTRQLLTALKKCLRAKGLTYRDVADALDLSEASVKRIFSEETFSLKRLEEVCRFLDLSIYDLAKLTRLDAEEASTVLDLAQERALAADSTLLTYFYLLLTGHTPAQIVREFGLERNQQSRILAKLDRLKLIEVYPRDRVRLLTSRRIDWRADGPVRRLYEAQVKEEFVRARFNGADEVLRFESGELSDASIKVLGRKLDKLSQEFDEFAELDMALPKDAKRGFGLLVGLRPWTYWQILEQSTQQLAPRAAQQRQGGGYGAGRGGPSYSQ